MRGGLALGLVLLFVLAGCATSSTSTSSTAATSAAPGVKVTGSSVPPSNRTNHPPTAALMATVYGLQANLTLIGADPDHDALNWTLAFGDGNKTQGSTLPQNVTHIFGAGTYNLTFVVSDGAANATASATITLNATQAAFPPITITGSAKLPCAQCSNGGANTGVGYRAGQNGLDYFWSEVPATAAGQPFSLTSSGGNPDVVFRDSCSGGAAIGNPFQAGNAETGVVPDGAVCALMWEEQMPQSAFTLVIGTPAA